MEIKGLTSENIWDYENGFYWFSEVSRLNKMLAQYELYKMISGLPGDVFELGVYKMVSLVRLATFRTSLENDVSRRIVGFDAFGKFPTDKLSLDDDRDFIQRFEGGGGEGLSLDDAKRVLSQKGFTNVSLIEGNIFETLPRYLEENPQTRISLLHLDVDVKEPTEFALDLLYERIVPNGLIVIDDYNAVAGATQAADAFVRKHGLELAKLPFYNVPSYIRKP